MSWRHENELTASWRQVGELTASSRTAMVVSRLTIKHWPLQNQQIQYKGKIYNNFWSSYPLDSCCCVPPIPRVNRDQPFFTNNFFIFSQQQHSQVHQYNTNRAPVGFVHVCANSAPTYSPISRRLLCILLQFGLHRWSFQSAHLGYK